MTMATGFYGPSLEKCMESSFAGFNPANTIKVALVTDSYTPDFDTHDFYADLTNVVEDNPDWPTAGVTLTGVTSSIASGVWTFDDTGNVSQSGTSLTDVEGCVIYNDTITNDPLLIALDFGQPYVTTNGLFVITWNPSGLGQITY
jgi:hypothetical protein